MRKIFAKALAALVIVSSATASDAGSWVPDFLRPADVTPQLQLAVVEPQSHLLVASLNADVLPTLAIEPACPTLAVPPQVIATVSKYDQTDPAHATLDDGAALTRDTMLKPIRDSIRVVTSGESYGCAISTITAWAKAGSLTSMQSEDAYLSRDRLVSEIALLLLDARSHGALDGASMAIIGPWLTNIVATTTAFYDFRAGPNSKRNNHRYWAGLSVGTIGYLLGDAAARSWADRSFDLGVCQVDVDGHLPLELARGSQALNYHVYALRPLLALAELAQANGDNLKSDCNSGLDRLRASTLSALADPTEVAKLAGAAQDHLPSEGAYSSRLQLASLGITL